MKAFESELSKQSISGTIKLFMMYLMLYIWNELLMYLYNECGRTNGFFFSKTNELNIIPLQQQLFALDP